MSCKFWQILLASSEEWSLFIMTIHYLTEEGTMRRELQNNVLTEAYYRRQHPIGLLCYQSAEFMSKQGIQLMSSRLGATGDLIKWLVSWVSKYESWQTFLHIVASSSTSLVLHFGIEKYRLLWNQATVSAWQVSLPITCQAAYIVHCAAAAIQTVYCMSGTTSSRRGHLYI
jgi:hypothetical protein